MSASAFPQSLNAAQQVMVACQAGLGLTNDIGKGEGKANCWDDCEDFYQKCARLIHTHLELVRVVNNGELIACVEDRKSLVANLRLMREDLPRISKELADLHALHQGKTGGPKDDNDLMHSINLFQQYMLWQQQHDAVIMPVAAHLTEQIQKAELVFVSRQQAQDPTVVTDVEVKEVAADDTTH